MTSIECKPILYGTSFIIGCFGIWWTWLFLSRSTYSYFVIWLAVFVVAVRFLFECVWLFVGAATISRILLILSYLLMLFLILLLVTIIIMRLLLIILCLLALIHRFDIINISINITIATTYFHKLIPHILINLLISAE